MKSSQEECVLCCREITIYASGACDHPVCYECSTRMRVLCETNECPICRSDMPLVAFTKQLKEFSSVNQKDYIINKKYQILFEDESICRLFEALLENRCKNCDEVFPSFEKLSEHVRRIHELHYCDLCTDNLKIFTFERKSYSRKDLARHRRKGDPDQKSHRGHPLCEFCDQRYIDRDDLFRHVRREHFFCHFCDADGKYQFYKDYEYLKVHFRKDHYLCEEGDCMHEKFTSAFRTEIDLKAHRAVHHSKNKSRAEAKQARMLDFEFPLAPPNRPIGSSSPRGGRYNQYRRRIADDSKAREQSRSSQPAEVEKINTESVQEFPFLSDEINGRTTGSDISFAERLNSLTMQSYGRNPTPYRKNNIMSAEEFPALCSTSSEVINSQNRKANLGMNRPSNILAGNANAASQMSHRHTTIQNFNVNSSDKKSKAGDSKTNVKAPQQGKWITKKNNPNFEEEFPMLEVKKAPSYPTVLTPVSTAPDTATTTSTMRKSNNNTEPQFGEQFIVIKSKSKKKKPRLPPSEVDYDEEPSSKLSLKNNSAVDEEEELKDIYKKHMVPPALVSLISKPSSYKENDFWEEKVSFRKDDFPPLEAPSIPPKKPPPGFRNSKARAPPPGFSSNSNTEMDTAPKTKVLSLSSVGDIIMQSQNKANGVDNLSNSLSEQENSNVHHMYIKPPNFQDRNLTLINRITDLPSVNSFLFQEFKHTSGQYRSDAISAAEFHDKCLDILGRRGFLEIFSELITLLPDIGKQRELLAVHRKYLLERDSDMDNYPITSCTLCNQVLVKRDYANHVQFHESESQ